jgi:hypothetical protein
VDCLNRNGARKQFAPYWTCESLFTCNLAPSGFHIALDGERVVGCAACWDQNSFKQTILRGYSGAVAHWRKFINLVSRLGFAPHLPEPNTPLRYSYASHLAMDEDDPLVFAALLRFLYNHNLEQGYRYFVIGLPESTTLRAQVEAYRPLTYTSRIYLVNWEEEDGGLAGIDHRIPGMEIALL